MFVDFHIIQQYFFWVIQRILPMRRAEILAGNVWSSVNSGGIYTHSCTRVVWSHLLGLLLLSFMRKWRSTQAPTSASSSHSIWDYHHLFAWWLTRPVSIQELIQDLRSSSPSSASGSDSQDDLLGWSLMMSPSSNPQMLLFVILIMQVAIKNIV